MKMVHITFQFQYAEDIEGMLDAHGVEDFVRYPRVAGRDRDGRHDGSQAFPGHMTCVEAYVPAARVGPLLQALRTFRDAKKAHRHLRAAVLPVEQTL